MIQLYLIHLKFLSECPGRLPSPHLILHSQEVSLWEFARIMGSACQYRHI